MSFSLNGFGSAGIRPACFIEGACRQDAGALGKTLSLKSPLKVLYSQATDD